MNPFRLTRYPSYWVILKGLPVLLILFSFGRSELLGQDSESVKVTVTNGELIRCITDNRVAIELIPNPKKTLLSMELYWEEDQANPIVVRPGDNFKLTNEYDLEEFEEQCFYDCRSENGFCRRIEVFANYEGGEGTRENNSLLLTFKVPPKPDFDVDPGVPCAEFPADIQNNTCPSNDESISYLWEFEDHGTSEDGNPQVTFTEAGVYTIKLTATSEVCGSASISKSIRIIEPAIAEAVPDQGITAEADGAYIICGQGGFRTRLIASGSPGANIFQWTTTNFGVNIQDPKNDTTAVTFAEPGDYTVTLEVDNGCGQPDQQQLQFKVVAAQAINLQAQADVCTELSYTPNPLVTEATYRINGEVVDVNSFPRLLPASPDPYVVTVELTNDCGDQTSSDEFFVRDPEPVQLLAPSSDTTLCLNNSPFILVASDTTGNWTINGIPSDPEFNPAQFMEGTHTVSFTAGEAGCISTVSADITVLPGPTVDIGPDQSICIDAGDITLTASPTDGTWKGPGITDSLNGTFNAGLAQVGAHTISYTFQDAAQGCVTTVDKVITVTGLPTIDLPDTLRVCDAPAPIDLSEVVNTTVMPDGGVLSWRGTGVDEATGTLNTKAIGGSSLITIAAVYTIEPACQTTDSIVVGVSPLVAASSSRDTTVCNSQSPIAIRGFPEDAGGGWTNEQGASVTVPIDPSSLNVGDHTFTFTIFGGTTCESSSTTTVTVVDGNGVSAGDDLYVCETENAFELPAKEGDWMGPDLNGRTVERIPVGPDTIAYTLVNAALPPACNSDLIDLIIQAQPNVSFNPDTSNCINVPVAMNNIVEGDRYLWDFGDSNTSTEQNPSHPFSQSGIFSVQLTIQSLNPNTNELVCQNSATRQVRIFEAPTFVGFTADQEEGCDTLVVNFTNQSQGERLNFVWDFGNDSTSTLVNPREVRFFTQGFDTTYQVSLQVANGCGGKEAQLPVTVLAKPRARFASEITRQYCSGEIVEFGHRSIADSLIWDFGNATTYSGFEPPDQQYFTSLDNDTINISLVAFNQCGIDTARQPLVIVPTDARADISVLDNRPCVGDTVFLQSLSRPLDAPVEWRFPDGSKGNGIETFFVFQDTGRQVVTTKVYSCGLDSADLVFDVRTQPEISLFAPPQSCPNTDVPIQLEGSEVQQSIFVEGIFLSGNNRVTTQFDSIGRYSIRGRVESPEGCIVEAERIIEVIPGPTAAFADPDSVCVGQFFELNSSSQGTASCFWKLSDGATFGACTVRHQFAAEGMQSAELVVTNGIGCQDAISKTIFVRSSPIARFGFDIIEDCTPALVNFRDSSSNANVLEWRFPNGDRRAVRAFSYTFSAAGSFPIQLITSKDGICFDTTTQTIPIFGSPQITLDKTEACTRTDGFTLAITTNPPAQVTVNGPNYTDFGTLHQELPPGDYLVFAETENGCIADTMTNIPIVRELTLEIPTDTFRITLGESVPLKGIVNLADVNIKWSSEAYLDDPTSLTPIATPFKNTDFVLEVTDNRGCIKQGIITVIVTIDREKGIYIPNAFTPDFSGHNDVFRVRVTNKSVEQIELFRVTDQNGSIVFEARDCDPQDASCVWDGTFKGKEVRPGVYIYQAHLRFADEEIIIRTGDVTLIR